MTIKSVSQLQVGQAGLKPIKWIINTDDNYSTVTTAGYLTDFANNFGYKFSPGDLADVSLLDDNVISTGSFQISILNGVVSLTNPSNIVDVSGTPTANQISYFLDSNTISATENSYIYHSGDIHAGKSAVAGGFKSHPGTPYTGSLSLVANDSSNNITITNESTESALTNTLTIPYGGLTNDNIAQSFMMSDVPVCDVGSNIIYRDLFISDTEISGANVKVLLNTFDKFYRVRDIFITSATSFTGGDRDLLVSTALTELTIIPSSVLLSMVNARWGSVSVPFPSGAIFTASQFNITAKSQGGTTDYTGGSISITLVLQRVIY